MADAIEQILERLATRLDELEKRLTCIELTRRQVILMELGGIEDREGLERTKPPRRKRQMQSEQN